MYDINNTCRTCGLACGPIKYSIGTQFKTHDTVLLLDLLALLQLDLKEDDGFPQQICKYCYTKLFQIHTFRTTCQMFQVKFQKSLNLMQNKIEDHNILPETSVQLEEKPNEETILAIKEEFITEDSERPMSVLNSDQTESTITAIGVKREIPCNDDENETPAVKRIAISNEFDSTMAAGKEEVINEDYDMPINSVVSEDGIVGCGSEDDKTAIYDKNGIPFEKNTGNDSSTPSKLESDEEKTIERKLVDWKCEYYIEKETRGESEEVCESCKDQNPDIREHLRTCRKPKKEICKLCTLYFSTKADLEKHMARTHDGWILCTICSKILPDYNTLVQHLQLHSTLFCTKCKMTFKTFNNMADHIARHHAKIINQQCPDCGLLCSTEFHFNRHMKRHIRNQCQYCGKDFSQMHRQIHERFRKGECPYMCEVCKNCFGVKPKHNPVKLTCSYCHMHFTRQYTYIRHMQMHEYQANKNESYSCSKCSMAFPLYHEARKHFEIHSKQHVYICPQCHDNFILFNDLMSHVELFHESV